MLCEFQSNEKNYHNVLHYKNNMIIKKRKKLPITLDLTFQCEEFKLHTFCKYVQRYMHRKLMTAVFVMEITKIP
jgi:hypothetical protein